MGYRLSKIYTRTGDDGFTQVGPGHRIPKDDNCIEALGTLDELNCAIGLTLAFIKNLEIEQCLTQVQHDLFNSGGELCPPHQFVMIPEKVTALETLIDKWNADLPPLKEFILPKGNLASTHCHMARAICRRAERRLVTLNQVIHLNPDTLKYINRLSDLLFVAARVLGRDTGEKEVLWAPSSP